MLQVTLAQLRVHARRFIAVGLAVMLGVAFLSATLMVSATTKASLAQSIGASYARADLVITRADGGDISADAVDDLTAVPGVEAVHPLERVFTKLTTGSQTSRAVLTSTAPEQLETAVMDRGSYPSGVHEVALDAASAVRLDISPGDTVAVDPQATSTSPLTALTVTGLIEPSNDPTVADAVQVLASPPVVRELTGDIAGFQRVQLALSPGADAAAVTGEVTAALGDTPDGAGPVVRTAADQTVSDVAALSDGTDRLTGILLAFAGVAVIVAGLVISNTFSVLVTQRTRELALLRCIGAQRRQVQTSVLIEAAITGLVSAVLGVLLAVGVMAILVGLARGTGSSSFAVLSVPLPAVLVGMAVGVAMTLLAAVAPARAATRVAPLAALRPADPTPVRSRSGRIRLAGGAVLLAAGGTLLFVGSQTAGIIPAVAGGAFSFLGIVLFAPFFLPRSVAVVGRIARPLGVAGTLASVNVLRNPARTTASSVALMVGVTLVSMMMVGAQTARASFDRELDGNYAVDLAVAGTGMGAAGADGSDPEAERLDASALLRVDGVQNVVELTPVMLTGSDDGGQLVYAADADAISAVLRSTGVALTDGIVLAPQAWKQTEVTLDGRGGPSTLPVIPTDASFFLPLITTETAGQLGGTPQDALLKYAGYTRESVISQSLSGQDLASYIGQTFWLKLDDGLDTASIVDVQSRIVDATGVSEYQVTGSAIERAAYNQIIDFMLLIVTALLGVAVLIALIGVANTLSLSVLERRRENSLLRALGLTRGQLRGTLAIEAALIAGVAALLGSVLGIVYGWLGARSALGGITTVSPSIPVGQLLAVLAVAVAAGLLASVLPARRAARLSPVSGLAAE